MTLVWERAEVPANELLILLALADNASDDGLDCWPSLDTLSAKCRCSNRTAFGTLQRLEKKGYINIIRPGLGRGKTNSYEFNVEFLFSFKPKYLNSRKKSVQTFHTSSGRKYAADSKESMQPATDKYEDPGNVIRKNHPEPSSSTTSKNKSNGKNLFDSFLPGIGKLQ